MRRISTYAFRSALPGMALATVMATGLALAQDQTPQAANPEPVDRSAAQSDAYGQPSASGPQHSAPPAYGLPPQVTLRPGSYVTVRVNQVLSSDRNHAGDTFLATLVHPVIVDGVVVAPRGQLIYGRVADAEKAHGGKDSRLGLELTSLTLADGTQAPVRSQLVARQGPQNPGNPEAATVVGTADSSAASGSSTGATPTPVLLTHSHPTVLYSDTTLTFAITAPVAINTSNAPQAFRFAGAEDYQQANVTQVNPTQPQTNRPVYVYGPGYYPYYYPYYPYYWGPSFGIGFGYGGWGRHWR